MDYPKITSRKHPLILQAKELKSSREARWERKEFLCEGARLCGDCAQSGMHITQCFATPSGAEKYGEYLSQVEKAGAVPHFIEEHVAQLLADTKNSQGIFVVADLPKQLCHGMEVPSGRSCGVLENLQDPGNLGTVLRTAEALGIAQVVLAGTCCDVLSPKVLRSAMGAVFRLPIFVESSIERAAQLLREAGFSQLAAVPDASAPPVTQWSAVRTPTAVWIGNEGNGLSEEAIALCDSRVTIPMRGHGESLNASAAATILLWEMAGRGEEQDG